MFECYVLGRFILPCLKKNTFGKKNLYTRLPRGGVKYGLNDSLTCFFTVYQPFIPTCKNKSFFSEFYIKKIILENDVFLSGAYSTI